MADVYRRCGCRDADGKTLGAQCPKLKSDPKHGTWTYYLAAGADPQTGRRRQIRKTGYPTKKAAQQARNEAAAALDKDGYREPSKQTVGEYLTAWLPRRQRNGLKETTAVQYGRYIAADIAPSPLAHMRLTEVRKHHVVAFVDALVAAGRGPTTIRRVVAVVQSAMRDAAAEQRIHDNPARGLRLPAVQRHEFQPWEPEQIGHFLDVAAEHRLGDMFTVATFTGMRRGELVGLLWDDVDLERREISVRRARVQAGHDVVETSPKSRAGRRIIELDDATVGALLSWQIRQASEAEEWGDAWQRTGYVFTYEDGTPLIPEYASRLFERLQAQAGLSGLTLHSLRHMQASLLLASGADIAVVSKRLGHSTVALTADTYSHLIAQVSRRAAEGASALVPRSTAHTVHTRSAE